MDFRLWNKNQNKYQCWNLIMTHISATILMWFQLMLLTSDIVHNLYQGEQILWNLAHDTALCLAMGKIYYLAHLYITCRRRSLSKTNITLINGSHGLVHRTFHISSAVGNSFLLSLLGCNDLLYRSFDFFDDFLV